MQKHMSIYLFLILTIICFVVSPVLAENTYYFNQQKQNMVTLDNKQLPLGGNYKVTLNFQLERDKTQVLDTDAIKKAIADIQTNTNFISNVIYQLKQTATAKYEEADSVSYKVNYKELGLFKNDLKEALPEKYRHQIDVAFNNLDIDQINTNVTNIVKYADSVTSMIPLKDIQYSVRNILSKSIIGGFVGYNVAKTLSNTSLDSVTLVQSLVTHSVNDIVDEKKTDACPSCIKLNYKSLKDFSKSTAAYTYGSLVGVIIQALLDATPKAIVAGTAVGAGAGAVGGIGGGVIGLIIGGIKTIIGGLGGATLGGIGGGLLTGGLAGIASAIVGGLGGAAVLGIIGAVVGLIIARLAAFIIDPIAGFIGGIISFLFGTVISLVINAIIGVISFVINIVVGLISGFISGSITAIIVGLLIAGFILLPLFLLFVAAPGALALILGVLACLTIIFIPVGLLIFLIGGGIGIINLIALILISIIGVIPIMLISGGIVGTIVLAILVLAVPLIIAVLGFLLGEVVIALPIGIIGGIISSQLAKLALLPIGTIIVGLIGAGIGGVGGAGIMGLVNAIMGAIGGGIGGAVAGGGISTAVTGLIGIPANTVVHGAIGAGLLGISTLVIVTIAGIAIFSVLGLMSAGIVGVKVASDTSKVETGSTLSVTYTMDTLVGMATILVGGAIGSITSMFNLTPNVSELEDDTKDGQSVNEANNTIKEFVAQLTDIVDQSNFKQIYEASTVAMKNILSRKDINEKNAVSILVDELIVDFNSVAPKFASELKNLRNQYDLDTISGQAKAIEYINSKISKRVDSFINDLNKSMKVNPALAQ
jgi:hypothetical protein